MRRGFPFGKNKGRTLGQVYKVDTKEEVIDKSSNERKRKDGREIASSKSEKIRRSMKESFYGSSVSYNTPSPQLAYPMAQHQLYPSCASEDIRSIHSSAYSSMPHIFGHREAFHPLGLGGTRQT